MSTNFDPFRKVIKLRLPDQTDMIDGLSLFCLGFFKKVLIADGCSSFVDAVFAHPSEFKRSVLLKAILGYTVQIWADFSGYTDMGRGAARMLGFKLPKNFLSPYLSRSPSEFWRRWHITLSQWIRDYIYIPLGGSSGGLMCASLVALATMLISGLWHGANWTYLVWGLFHGTLLLGERLFKKSLPKRMPVTRGFAWVQTSSSIFLMFSLTSLGWLVFRAPS